MVTLAQLGKESSWNMATPHVLMARLMVRTPIMFKINPALAMSMTLRFPKEKAMALGGVATGSMKASEVAMVHGSITYSGCILMAVAMEARIGRKRVVVAVLLEHSVNAATSIVIRMVMAYGGMLCSGMRLSPSHRESPDFSLP